MAEDGFGARGAEDREEELRVPALRALADVVLEAVGRRILPGDARSSEQHVPDEEEIAVVPHVMADAIVLGKRVVREMGGRRGDRAFEDPCDRTQGGVPVERSIPTDRGMRADDDGEFHDAVPDVGPSESHVQQDTAEPEPGHQGVVEGIVPIVEILPMLVIVPIPVIVPTDAIKYAIKEFGTETRCNIPPNLSKGYLITVPQILKSIKEYKENV